MKNKIKIILICVTVNLIIAGIVLVLFCILEKNKVKEENNKYNIINQIFINNFTQYKKLVIYRIYNNDS